MRLSPTKNMDAVEGSALTTHRSSDGKNHSDVVANTALLTEDDRVAVTGCELETLNNEQSTAIGGAAANEFVPSSIVFHLEDVGVGAAANGDVQVSVGITPGGTEILVATALTNIKLLNDHFVVAIDGLTVTILANSTIYVKITTADTTAGVGHLLDAYVVGTIFTSGT